MIPAIQSLSDTDLREIGLALRAGRLSPPFSAASLQRYCSTQSASPVAQAMQKLVDEGLRTEHLALMFESLAEAKAGSQDQLDSVDLVWTGPEVIGIANRDTSVVVRELFSNASESVLVAGYAVYQGRHVFRSLAKRMDESPGLTVRLFLDVPASLRSPIPHSRMAQ